MSKEQANKKSKALIFTLMVSLFLCSIVVRMPKFNGYLGWHHQWLTAHTLLTLSIWDDNGIAKYNFNPVYTYNTPEDQNIQSLTSGISDDQGNFYYVSYPPFSFLFAYAVLQSVPKATPTPYSMYVLNLGLHFITAFLLYLLINSLFQRNSFQDFLDPGMIGFVLYLFLPLPLWYHGHVYFADILIQPLWFGGMILAIQLFWRNKIDRPLYPIAFGIICFLMTYTEWLGVFFSFTTFVFALVYAIKDKRYLKLIFIISTCTLAALAVTIIQYSAISGWDNFAQASLEKYSSRGGVPEYNFYIFYIQLLKTLRAFFHQNIPLVTIIVFLLLTSLILKRQQKQPIKPYGWFVIATLLYVPALMHHIVFLDFTFIHDFALLKTVTFLIILSAGLYHRTEIALKVKETLSFQYIMGFVIGILILLSCFIYYNTNKAVDSPVFSDISKTIKATSTPEDVLFITGNRQFFEKVVLLDEQESSAVAPQVQLSTKRNILAAPDTSYIWSHLKNTNQTQAVVYTINSSAQITQIQKITVRD